MLAKYLLFSLLSTIAYSRINIQIKPGKTSEEVSVHFSGSDTSVISDKERKTFGLDDETLKKATEKYKGKRCDDVYLKAPTPWGNVYDKYDWNQVMRTLKPVRAKVLGVQSKPVAVAEAKYTNNHHNIDVTYSTSVTQQVEETVGHTWSSGGELSIGQEINYNVNFGAGSVGGSTSLSYTSTWGEDQTKSRTVTLGTTSTVSTSIPPGGKVVAVLSATQGTLDIEIYYEATLSGLVFCNYANTYKGHHFYGFSISNLQYYQKLPQTVRTTEKMSIGFFTSARIEVNNGTTHKEIKEKPAGIIDVGPQKIKN